MLSPEEFERVRYGDKTKATIAQVADLLLRRRWDSQHKQATFASGVLYDLLRKHLDIEYVEGEFIGIFKDILKNNGWNVEISNDLSVAHGNQYKITPAAKE